jgi:hypothetical protein
MRVGILEALESSTVGGGFWKAHQRCFDRHDEYYFVQQINMNKYPLSFQTAVTEIARWVSRTFGKHPHFENAGGERQHIVRFPLLFGMYI